LRCSVEISVECKDFFQAVFRYELFEHLLLQSLVMVYLCLLSSLLMMKTQILKLTSITL